MKYTHMSMEDLESLRLVKEAELEVARLALQSVAVAETDRDRKQSLENQLSNMTAADIAELKSRLDTPPAQSMSAPGIDSHEEFGVIGQ